MSAKYLSSKAELHWPWPPAEPVPAGPTPAGTAHVCRLTTRVFFCRPGLTVWKVQRSVSPGTPPGGVPGGRKAPSRLVCLAKAWRPTRGRRQVMRVIIVGRAFMWHCKLIYVNTPHTCRTLRWSAEKRGPTSGSFSLVPLVKASFLSLL